MSAPLMLGAHFPLAARRGIALAEVLVSVSILSASFGALLWCIANSTRAQSGLAQREIGRLLAERQALVLRRQDLDGQEGELSGEFGAPYEGYAWSARLESAADGTPFAVFGLTVTRKTAAGSVPLYALRTIFHAGT